ncbi:phospholipase C [Sphingomonas oryzagri]|uniref:Alkaline phosphatase family protein n=1 Tax=Sphingomonas oryzagri TaxID=3042314 RepID=A0ABT6MXL2_9SPHN|nr:alkaline phosphatase family protein [Sphingomonas oryzagri]MDH7637793.1 alkaline phosphatase family protein [Sphingomonas oryzagri]
MIRKHLSSALKIGCMALLLSSCGHSRDSGSSTGGGGTTTPVSEQDALSTATPIKHLVVIFGENESFDHYFGTYPQSKDPSGEPTEAWVAPSNVANVNGYIRNASLLTANPNTTNASNLAKVSDASMLNPFRLDRSQFDTASQNHAYTPEQLATNNLKMDAFVANTGKGGTGGTPSPSSGAASGAFTTAAQVMGYFDGNTVTGLWNYAQNFAMSDNAFTDSFGPSTPGALNVVSGTTSGADKLVTGDTIPDGQGKFTMVNDADPTGDMCSNAAIVTTMAGKNIGDLLNAAKITWGGFMGGFDTSATNANGTTGCARSTVSPNTSRTVKDYTPHHAWFQYYASTMNPNHTRPSSTAMIGHTETADGPVDPNSATISTSKAVNHQYDYNDFVAAVSAGNFASVSYIKAPAFQDAHPGNSNALDEQAFVAKVINFLQQQPDWKNTAVIVTYDDSDGWYDHQSPNVLRSSFDATTTASVNLPSGTVTGADQMNSQGVCTGPNAKQATDVNGKKINGRCGPGTRIPFILISPYAKVNYVDSTPISQASVIRFIEDNWLNGQRIGGGSADADAGSIMGMFDFSSAPHTTAVFIDPTTGKKTATAPTA